MRIKESIDRLSCRTGNGIIPFIFGLPFFLMGCFFFWNGLTTEHINQAPPTISTRLGVCAFSSIFIFIGFGCMAGFKKYIIDKRRKTITKSWGVLVPFHSKSQPLMEIDFIEVNVEVRVHRGSEGGTTRTTVYPVKLSHGRDKEVIAEPRNLLEARRLSERVSLFLQLPIKDSSLGVTLHREVDELDASIKDMMKMYGVKVENPKVPNSLKNRITVDYNNDGEKITTVSFGQFYKQDPKPFTFFLTVLVMAYSVLVYKTFTFESSHEGSTYFFDLIDHHFALTSIIPGLIALAVSKKVLLALMKESVAISATKLKHTRSLFLLFSKSMPLVNLEHIIVRETNKTRQMGQMTLVSDDFCMDIINYRSLEEVRYIEQLIQFKVQ